MVDTAPDLSAKVPECVAVSRCRPWRQIRRLSVVSVLAGLLVLVLLPHGQRSVELAETTPPVKPTAAPVQVVTPKRSAASSDVLLPGNVQAVQEASLFARTNGYVHRRLVDIGDRVTA